VEEESKEGLFEEELMRSRRRSMLSEEEGFRGLEKEKSTGLGWSKQLAEPVEWRLRWLVKGSDGECLVKLLLLKE